MSSIGGRGARTNGSRSDGVPLTAGKQVSSGTRPGTPAPPHERLEASRRFWMALGGVTVHNGQLELFQLPGMFVTLRESEQITGGSEEWTVERVVSESGTRNCPLIQKLEQAIGSKLTSAVLMSPEGVMIELRGAMSQEAAVRMERLVFKTVAPAETRDCISS
jgi:hypothetical protein